MSLFEARISLVVPAFPMLAAVIVQSRNEDTKNRERIKGSL